MNIHEYLIKSAAAKTKALDNHPALKGKQTSELPDKVQAMIIKKKMEKTGKAKRFLRIRKARMKAEARGNDALADRLSDAEMTAGSAYSRRIAKHSGRLRDFPGSRFFSDKADTLPSGSPRRTARAAFTTAVDGPRIAKNMYRYRRAIGEGRRQAFKGIGGGGFDDMANMAQKATKRR